MKRILFLAPLLAVSLQCEHAAAQVVTEPWHVTERTAHSRVWESVELVADAATGRITPQKHSYVELATGLHYFDTISSQWQESKEMFTITATGDAVALKGQHQLRLAANINSGGSVNLLSDSKTFRSNPMGLSFFDSATGKNVLIAEVKDCVGKQVAPNVILYDDAFDSGINGAIRYIYTKDGFSQDIIVYQNLGSPGDWGLNEASSFLVMYTEFHDSPWPRRDAAVPATNQPITKVELGQMRVGRGLAYFQSQELESTTVSTEWLNLEGRDSPRHRHALKGSVPAIVELFSAIFSEAVGERGPVLQ